MHDDILEDGSLHLNKEDQGLTPNASASILRSVKWGKIMLGISGVALLIQLGAQLAISQRDQSGELPFSPATTLLLVIFFMALIYGYPIVKFIGFLTKTPNGINNQDHEKFVDGITNLKSSIKYVGILIFAILALYLVILFFAIIIGGFNSF